MCAQTQDCELGRGKEGDRGSKSGSVLTADSWMRIELTDHEIMTWAAVGCLTDWANQAPLKIYLLNVYLFILRERESMSRGVAEWEGEKESQGGSTLNVEVNVEVVEEGDGEAPSQDLTTIKSLTLNQLSHSDAPKTILIIDLGW